MRRYRIIYLNGNRSKPVRLIQISKIGKWVAVRWDGARSVFFDDGRKCWQDNWKNYLRNGLDKWWEYNSKNWYFQNWKKGKTKGIRITFKQKNT